jgi:hypothetical protein
MASRMVLFSVGSGTAHPRVSSTGES